MNNRYATNFLIGFVIGGLLCLLFWYWQKSTSVEDGALELLDRLADSEARLHRLQSRPLPTPADNLEVVKGIGPVFTQRLLEAGVATIAAVASLDTAHLAHILQISEGRAQRILQEARLVNPTG